MLKQERQTGIVTADKKYLTRPHLEYAGIASSIPVCIMGVEATGEFSKVRTDPGAKLNTAEFIQATVDIAKMLVSDKLNVGTIVRSVQICPPLLRQSGKHPGYLVSISSR
jgi:hypothetical protein